MQNLGVVALLQGDAKSGKTRFVACHTNQASLGYTYEATVEDEYSVAALIRGQKLTATLLDTGGDPECEPNLAGWTERAQAQILFINVEDPRSLDYLRAHSSVFAATKSHLLAGIVVGNLPSGNEANRKVSYQEGANLAASFSWAEFSYLETNTYTGDGVADVVATLMESLGRSLPLSGAEKVPMETKGEQNRPNHRKENSKDSIVKTWALSLGMSREAEEIISELSWPELEAMFASDVPTVKHELAQYGLIKASDRNKLIAGWRTRQFHTKQHKMDRIKSLESRMQEQEQQLQAAATRIEVLETQLSDASWTHRIQELFLKQLQSIGWAKKEPVDATPVTVPVAAEEVTPVKPKAVRGGRKNNIPLRGGGLFASPLK